MVGVHYLSVLSCVASIAVAQDPFYMCTDTKCEECPSAVSSTGTGYPDCVIYSSEDVFVNQGYSGSEGGGYSVYFDVQEHEPGCATIVKSPASTDLVGCGAAIAAFKQPACVLLNLETTFMLQNCCGDDCDSAGAKMIRGIGQMGAPRSVLLDGRGGLLLKYANGTIIEPAEIAPPSAPVNAGSMKRQALRTTEQRLQKRSCTENSWKGGEVFTKPADNVQIVATALRGQGEITVSKARTQSWSTSMSIGIADVLSLGVSTEFSKSVTSSTQRTFNIAEGQEGKLGFTATLSCSTGTGQCDGGEVEGEICWPTMDGDDVAGTYRPIISS
ncbi:hypothetical protein DDE82_008995 [Stemphylium lycopersici]|uniref:Uncharacterized protein n=1 Tax=Stemphylium lycopersici TaxID=183478 RepID=A0A364MRH1_STELY|nr:hypothetical protein DDE82_008995 [Stemphylium lycopersici]RAR00784.1 hypothetical protein DDE83_009048 [Stemphylium lycopersici]